MNTTTPASRLLSNRNWKARNREKYLAYCRKYNAERRANPVRLARLIEQNKASDSKPERAKKMREYDRSRDRTKLRARQAVRDRVFNGTLKRKPCEVCGSKKSEAHHEDYTKKLEVKWLCPKHHKELHAKQ